MSHLIAWTLYHRLVVLHGSITKSANLSSVSVNDMLHQFRLQAFYIYSYHGYHNARCYARLWQSIDHYKPSLAIIYQTQFSTIITRSLGSHQCWCFCWIPEMCEMVGDLQEWPQLLHWSPVPPNKATFVGVGRGMLWTCHARVGRGDGWRQSERLVGHIVV